MLKSFCAYIHVDFAVIGKPFMNSEWDEMLLEVRYISTK
jgi:hypothetical protein